nr:RNB domain-containing ribonuclease [Treponema sp.]
TGIWSITRNPYPVRLGLSAKSSTVSLGLPPDEERVKVPGFSYAIDSQWSTDPDDAIAFDGEYLWVHIADPASCVAPDSQIDKAARGRGATLYLPEGAARMLSEDCLEDYALGLREESRALSFKLKLNDKGDIEDCQVLRTLVNVKRLTYEKADELKESPELKPLFEIARRNFERRCNAGAVNISIPEVHMSVDPETKEVSFETLSHPESTEVVREAMVLAGEGAAKFAFKNNIPFPFISQESPEIPKDIPEGLAGQFRLRKCMRKRNVNVTPSSHAGLGVGMYSQVTSPLRRYGDLLGHQQLRAFLKGEPLIDKDTMLMRMSEGDAAMQASKKAERNSRTHWTLVYLLQHPDWTGEAVCVDKQAGRALYFISELGLETVIGGEAPVDLNGTVTLKAGKIDLPNLEVTFSFV